MVRSFARGRPASGIRAGDGDERASNPPLHLDHELVEVGAPGTRVSHHPTFDHVRSPTKGRSRPESATPR